MVLLVSSLLAHRHGLASHVEGETQAALHRDPHRPGLHSHVIPHGDGVEEGAGAILAHRHEADCLPPSRMLRPLPALGLRLDPPRLPPSAVQYKCNMR